MTRPQTTVLAALAERLTADPDGPYLDFSNSGDDIVQLTAREMDRASNRLAHSLREMGVEHGDRVATLLENRAEQVVSFFAALKLGAIQVPINTAYKGEFLRHQLSDSGAKVFIVQGDFASRAVEVVGDATTPALTHCITVDPPDAVIDARPVVSWQDVLDAGSDAPVADANVRPGDLACFIYTAGTTGPSKGCMLPHNYIVSLADQIARAWQRRPDDVVLTPLPLFHFNAISVCVVGSLLTGGHAAIERRFSVSNFWPEIKRTGATMVSMLGSPAILIANAEDHPDQQGHKLRLCAAAPMPPDTDQAWQERFGCKTFSGGYGLTEASLISMLDAGEPNKPGAAGKPNQHEFEVRLVGDDDVEVAAGRGRRDRLPPDRPEPDVRGLLEPARRDRRGDAQPLVPHRRPRAHRRRRLHLLRRPQEGRAAPPGREHLELRDGKGALRARADQGRGRARGAEPARRGRREGHRRAAGRRRRSARKSCAAGSPSGCRSSRSRATSSSGPTCPATRSGGCSSTSSATRVSPSTPGTAKPPG